MKKLFFISLLIFSLTLKAQKKLKLSNGVHSADVVKIETTTSPANPLYTFSTYTVPYQEFTGVSVSNGLMWDDSNFPITMGFNFKLYGASGNIINFAEGSFATFDNPTLSVLTLATPMFEDLCDRAFLPATSNEGDSGGISDISYSVTGTVGNKICMIQVKDAGFYEEIAAYDTSESYVNFQLWLYEGTNDIEIRFGDVNIQNPQDNLLNPAGFHCGLAEQVDLNTAVNVSANVLNGPASNPAMVGLGTTLAEVVTGTVQSGRVYKFSRVNPNLVGISNVNFSEQMSFFPNPASTKLYCNTPADLMKEVEIYFYSLDGKLVSEKKLESEIDISEIGKGVYLLKTKSKNGDFHYSGKLVVIK
ncbi:T9SS type A sorting domain-containing protein [Aurantibacillus circumpalustris]|uniref:T9SS type A sorting domain-containing protein n=1 Tax=Aurantibacillus circumpalustris TaxID=3036359 RepID=UPI00295C129E|nr:T9SS type A sorting domain-containing protein [Aurantibacillus circumpalustris]